MFIQLLNYVKPALAQRCRPPRTHPAGNSRAHPPDAYPRADGIPGLVLEGCSAAGAGLTRARARIPGRILSGMSTGGSLTLTRADVILRRVHRM